MQKLLTLEVLEDALGYIPKSALSNESLYYRAFWTEIQPRAASIARKHNLNEPDDVRVADYALELLGIPNHYTEADTDGKGNWLVYWR